MAGDTDTFSPSPPLHSNGLTMPRFAPRCTRYPDRYPPLVTRLIYLYAFVATRQWCAAAELRNHTIDNNDARFSFVGNGWNWGGTCTTCASAPLPVASWSASTSHPGYPPPYATLEFTGTAVFVKLIVPSPSMLAEWNITHDPRFFIDDQEHPSLILPSSISGDSSFLYGVTMLAAYGLDGGTSHVLKIQNGLLGLPGDAGRPAALWLDEAIVTTRDDDGVDDTTASSSKTLTTSEPSTGTSSTLSATQPGTAGASTFAPTSLPKIRPYPTNATSTDGPSTSDPSYSGSLPDPRTTSIDDSSQNDQDANDGQKRGRKSSLLLPLVLSSVLGSSFITAVALLLLARRRRIEASGAVTPFMRQHRTSADYEQMANQVGEGRAASGDSDEPDRTSGLPTVDVHADRDPSGAESPAPTYRTEPCGFRIPPPTYHAEDSSP